MAYTRVTNVSNNISFEYLIIAQRMAQVETRMG